MNEAAKKLMERVENVTKKPRNILRRPDLTKAAVLVPIVFRDEAPHFILTKRTMNVAKHKGQISFPGGVREPEDPGEVENALREAREEIGLEPSSVKVVGLLDDFVTVTGFKVTPVVGLVDSDAYLSPDPVEVEEIFEAPLAVFVDPNNHELSTTDTSSGYSFHRYRFQNYDIWGATAGIIHRFLDALAHEEKEKIRS